MPLEFELLCNQFALRCFEDETFYPKLVAADIDWHDWPLTSLARKFMAIFVDKLTNFSWDFAKDDLEIVEMAKKLENMPIVDQAIPKQIGNLRMAYDRVREKHLALLLAYAIKQEPHKVNQLIDDFNLKKKAILSENLQFLEKYEDNLNLLRKNTANQEP